MEVEWEEDCRVAVGWLIITFELFKGFNLPLNIKWCMEQLQFEESLIGLTGMKGKLMDNLLLNLTRKLVQGSEILSILNEADFGIAATNSWKITF